MVSQGSYIIKRLRKKGWKKLAKKSSIIEKHMKKLYGSANTPLYKSTSTNPFNFDYDMGYINDKTKLSDILKNKEYNPACVDVIENNEGVIDCKKCEYGNIYGFCDDPNSEYAIFAKELKKKEK